MKLGPGRKLLLLAVAIPMPVGLYGQTAATNSQGPPTQRVFSPTERLEFDVASIKQSKSGASPYSNFSISFGTMYGPTGGIFSSTNRPLIDYIVFAYKMTPSQREDLMSQLPAWAVSDGFDIQAKSENHDPTKDQMRLMMQSLLADRFKLAVHTETRRVSISALVLVKPGITGPQLKPHVAEQSCS
ncbi:MAG TPA: TIGR03435 family protein, partial [Terracidiphilus sp.]|nr:TIGR03435 family protein [Terracidiphilus sp.]